MFHKHCPVRNLFFPLTSPPSILVNLDGFIVLPTALIVKDPCKKSDNSLEGLLDQSGQHGCSTEYVMKPNVELKFDRIYQFTTLECVSNKKYPDDQ